MQYGSTCSESDFENNFKSKFFSVCPQTLKNRDCLVSCLLYAVHGLLIVGFEDIFPVWAATYDSLNGLDFLPSHIGLLYFIVVPILIPLQIVMIPKVANHLSAKTIVISTSFLCIIGIPLVPCTERLKNKYLLWLVLILLMIFIRFLFTAQCTSICIFINNSVDEDQLSSANGLGMAMSAVGRASAPLIFGSIYSWSMTNVKHLNPDGLGFPFNQYVTFYLLCCICLMIAIPAAFFPDRLNKPRNSYV